MAYPGFFQMDDDFTGMNGKESFNDSPVSFAHRAEILHRIAQGQGVFGLIAINQKINTLVGIEIIKRFF
jgi:hypothetical protein